MTEKLSEARIKANKKWDQNNPDKKKKIRARSAAKSFINNYADNDDLDFLLGLINEKRKLNDK